MRAITNVLTASIKRRMWNFTVCACERWYGNRYFEVFLFSCYFFFKSYVSGVGSSSKKTQLNQAKERRRKFLWNKVIVAGKKYPIHLNRLSLKVIFFFLSLVCMCVCECALESLDFFLCSRLYIYYPCDGVGSKDSSKTCLKTFSIMFNTLKFILKKERWTGTHTQTECYLFEMDFKKKSSLKLKQQKNNESTEFYFYK